MKALYSVKWILLGALLMPGLTACSFFGGEEAPAEEVAANGEEGAADPNAEANAEGNTADPTANAENTENIENPESAPVEDAGPAFVDNGNANMGGENMVVPPDLLGSNPAPEANAMAGGETPPPPESLTPMENTAAAPTVSAPLSGTRVYFVNVPTLALRDRPDGQTVGELKMGDPVLVSVEGNWANVVNRGYVELASLSMGPVARAKTPTNWN